MLREIKSKQLKTRIGWFQTVTTSTPSITANIGLGNLSAQRRTGGLTALNALRSPFRQNVVWIASQINNNGGFVSDENGFNNGVTNEGLGYKILDNAASTTDGTANVFYVGTDSPTVDALPLSNIESQINRTRLVWGKVTSAGVVSIGTLGVTKTATGVYAITYDRAFGRTAAVFVTPIGAAFRGVKISNQTATGCTVSIHDATPTAQDNAFYILVVGTDSREETTRVGCIPQNAQRKPRIEAFQYTVSTGTETVTVGSKIATLTNNGAGDNTITFTEPFKREFAVFALAGPGASKVQAVAQAANTSSVARIQTYNVAGSLTDPSGGSPVHVIVIGSMDATEF